MSEVVPLPSFGEVFFDERGQERVLRVTWHEGTLVLSLWRGEMCTASFRMPMDDVGRLVDTLDEGFIEAGGQYPDEADEHASGGHAELPGTGQYARPRPEDYAQPQYTDPLSGQAVPQPEEPRQAVALGPNDVLVARGATPPPDRFQDRAPGYGPADAVPRENMIVGDSLPYGLPNLAEPGGPAEQPYQPAGDPYAAPQGHRQPDPYGTPDPYAAQPAPYGTPDSYGPPQDPHAAQPGPYAAQQPADPFARQPADAFSAPDRPVDAFSAPDRPVDAFSAPQRPVDPFTPHVDQFPSAARLPDPDAYPSQGHSTDPFGFAAQSRQSGHGAPAADPYGYPAPAQPDPYAFGEPRQASGAPQGGHPADLRDLYGAPPGYDPGMDPSDPLNLHGHQAEQRMPRPYVQDPPHSTGERLSPEQRYDEQHYDEQRYEGRGDRRDW
ncbi:hypothetical protein HS041_24690 [Planomonospora sp. ID67723]|uniref:hypothetical protein n=1 Tax=Planomonospora sp. ID67723 TaxID=2738134 RepID=UPI0018C42C0F|nr:hypothetical protein [Planomonospora sp. ID67723]MBG0830960.1 hypothetical protein [Planomonospora sp. ID67723]